MAFEVANASQIKVALVCLSNLNRSMEAHALFQKNGYASVRSFGTGSAVKLPGESKEEPNVYEFGDAYVNIAADLKKKNFQRSVYHTCLNWYHSILSILRYKRNGMIQMIERNMKVKAAPERWHNEAERFQIVVSYDRRAYESIIEGTFFSRRIWRIIAPEDVIHRPVREGFGINPVHLVNIETKDTHEEATNGALASLDLMERVCSLLSLPCFLVNAFLSMQICRSTDWESEIEDLLAEVEEKSGLSLLHSIYYY